MKKENLINKVIKEISENHAKIIDDFTKAYLSSRWEDYFGKQKKIDLKRLELVEDRSNPRKICYSFRLKRGKLKKNQNEKQRHIKTIHK